MREHGTVLVVDDDPSLRDLMALWLRSGGFGVRLASNGEEALASLKREPPCAMVVDLEMPVMGGAELRRRQRSIDEVADIPFILVSASADCERIGRSLDVADVIPKPFDSTRLLAVLHAACEPSH